MTLPEGPLPFLEHGASVSGSAAPAAITYLTRLSSSADLNTYTFASVSFGTASDNRVIICVAHSQPTAGTTFNQFTMGGVAGTIAVQHTTANPRMAIAYAPVPTGTTGDVVISLSAGARMVVDVYRATMSSTTPVDTAAVGSITAALTVVDLAVQIDGFALFGAARSATQSLVGAWSGADIPTQNASLVNDTYQFATWTIPTSETVTTNDFAISASASGQVFTAIGASWR